MKILVPDTIELDLTDLTSSGDEIVVYEVDKAIPGEHRDAEVLVVWRNTSDKLAPNPATTAKAPEPRL